MLQPDLSTRGSGAVEEAPSRAEVIAQAIRLAVVEQRVTPGTRLSEDQIGHLFGASRTIVRAALQRLAHDGMVTLTKNRGASVAAPTVSDARHLFDARQAVEGVVVRRAAERLTPADAEDLSDLIARGQRAVDGADRGLAIRLSGDFHLAIAAVACQPVLRAFLSELVSRSSLVIALYGRSRSADCGGDEHRALLAALQARDGEGAATLMGEHLAHIEADLDLEEQVRPAVALRDALLVGAARSGQVAPAGLTRRTGW